MKKWDYFARRRFVNLEERKKMGGEWMYDDLDGQLLFTDAVAFFDYMPDNRTIGWFCVVGNENERIENIPFNWILA